MNCKNSLKTKKEQAILSKIFKKCNLLKLKTKSENKLKCHFVTISNKFSKESEHKCS